MATLPKARTKERPAIRFLTNWHQYRKGDVIRPYAAGMREVLLKKEIAERVTEEEAEAQEAEPQKPRRGRPKGSKNKSKAYL
jgi:hypothetical protein